MGNPQTNIRDYPVWWHRLNLNSEVWGIVLVLLLVLILDLLAIRAEKGLDLSATLLFRPAWQRSGCFPEHEHDF